MRIKKSNLLNDDKMFNDGHSLVKDPRVASARMVQNKTFPSYFLLGGALFLFLLYLAIWPMVWHLVLLPYARPDKHQLRVDSYAPYRVDDTWLFLDRPDTSLTAYAVWQVPKEGFYHIKLSCDDNGKVSIDNRPIITLTGISVLNVGEVNQWLSAGPHFLELRLNNILNQGWLRIEVAEPGQDSYKNLKKEQISWLELGNIETWLDVVSCGEFFCLLGFLGLMLMGIAVFMQGYILKKNSIDGFLFLLLSLIFSFFWTQLRFDLINECKHATLIDLMNGNACIPFQYRFLVPSIVYLISEKLGFHYINTINFYKFFEFISIFSLVLAYRHYLTFLFNSKTAIYFFTFSLFVPLFYTFLLQGYFYPADIPSVLFFTLGLIFLYKKKWIAYYLIFAIGTFNRETTCFLTMICILVLFGKGKLRDLIIHGSLQILIWISIKTFLYHLFIANPGEGLFEKTHLLDNIELLTTQFYYYPHIFRGAVLFIWLPTLICSSLIKNEFIRRSIWVSIPFFIGMIFVGNVNEVRIYGELIPVLFPALLLILKDIFTKELTEST
jgi:hypothetical protein